MPVRHAFHISIVMTAILISKQQGFSLCTVLVT